MAKDRLRVAVVGATGAVGTTMLNLLDERAFPASEIVPFASERSIGKELSGGRITRGLSEESIKGFDLAIFSAGGSTSGEWAPRFAAAGATVIDNSSRWRTDPDVPLVVAEVNPEALSQRAKGIVANPNCSTMQMLVALKPIHQAVGIKRLVVTTLQAVSGTGLAAVTELRSQTEALIADAGSDVKPQIYPHRIAFNVIGAAGNFADGDDYTDEERKLIFETRKILDDQSIQITVTCTRVPVLNCHSETVNLQTVKPLSAAECRELLKAAPGLVVIDDPTQHSYPTVLDADGQDPVFVGRIREDVSVENGLNLWVVADNLRKGAATNAVQLAELLANEL